jgi:alkanesulfonate monooxygenase SsuD/methylene tetrahydromethanopterin reductase-like flavin-dependent oxidoreductase (luciferase family)
MLRLVARHADWWNAAWYGAPDEATELDERIGRLREACEAESRDPATLTLTAGIFVHFPDLEQDEEPPERAIAGDPDGVGRAMAGYREHGIEHLIVHCWPRSPAAVEALAEAAQVARVSAAEPAIR